MIKLITAVPGSGKTLSAISIIREAISNKRKVYTNIDSLKKELLDPEGKYLFDAPEDWRECPVNSLIIYDEAQEIFPANAKPGAVSDERLTALERHRHLGYDIIFITQHPSFVHHHIRKLVGEHTHLYRGHGSQVVAKYVWSHTEEQPNDRQRQERATSEPWKFPKENFQYYTSANVHTHKFKLPKKAIIIMSVLIGIIGFIVFKVSDLGGVGNFNAVSEVAATASPAPPPVLEPSPFYEYAKAEPLPVVSGCVSYKGICQCFNEDGRVLDLSDEICNNHKLRPLPRVLSKSE